MIKQLAPFRFVDIYLLDQAFKGRIPPKGNILDVGCGKGRNFSWLAEEGYQISGFDPDEEAIQALRTKFPAYEDQLHVSRIEDFHADMQYDFIICNAVLHFAANHSEFNRQFECLAKWLKPSGTLFIRMTCSMGIDVQTDINGRAVLPDLTERYILKYPQIDQLCSQHNLALLEPVKAVWVNGERSMATLVMTRID